ncbi:MAG: helix-turn-helix domain-containing protein [Candidatus Hodarchaeota archaeon]
MKICEILDDPIQSDILALISRCTRPIRAKQISEIVDVSLNTVETHLRDFEKRGFIAPIDATVKRFSKKTWRLDKEMLRFILEDSVNAKIFAQIAQHSGEISTNKLAIDIDVQEDEIKTHLHFLQKLGLINCDELESENWNENWRINDNAIQIILDDLIRVAILAQIARYSGSISAKEISKNIDIPLSTVYDHLRILEKIGFVTASEIKVKNLIQKVWHRSDTGIEISSSRVFNENFEQSFSKSPKAIVSYVNYLNGLLRENLVQLKRAESSSFEEHQANSFSPVLVKLFGLTREDYEFALKKLGELRRELYLRSQDRGDSEHRRTEFREEENHLLFLLAFPPLKF